MPFDADSGQVFDEVVVKKPKKSRDVSMQCTGRPPARKSPGPGSQPLVLVSLRKILCSLDQLDSDSLSTMPEKLLTRLWDAIQKS
jgi:hypothetical protein